jgi:hypothetical protein
LFLSPFPIEARCLVGNRHDARTRRGVPATYSALALPFASVTIDQPEGQDVEAFREVTPESLPPAASLALRTIARGDETLTVVGVGYLQRLSRRPSGAHRACEMR